MSKIASILAIVIAAATLTGCAQMERIFHQPGAGAVARVQPQPPARAMRLASYSTQAAPADKPATQKAETDTSKPDTAPQTEVTKPKPDAPADAKPKEEPKAYTAPGEAYRQLAFGQAVTAAALSLPGMIGADREAAYGFVLAPDGVAGRTGVTAPSTLAATNVIVGRPGLQENAVRGIGYASPQSNIFRAQRNPLTGPNGRCAELVRAGLFTDAAACRSHFKR